MALTDALDRYFDAWNAHDRDAVVAVAHRRRHLRGPDHRRAARPATRSPRTSTGLVGGLPRPALRGRARGAHERHDGRRAVAHARARTPAPMPMGPATGGTVDLPGADFLDLRPRRRPDQQGRRLLRHRIACSTSSAGRPERRAGANTASPRHFRGDERAERASCSPGAKQADRGIPDPPERRIAGKRLRNGTLALQIATSTQCGDERAERASCSPGANGREPGIPARSERRVVRDAGTPPMTKVVPSPRAARCARMVSWASPRTGSGRRCAAAGGDISASWSCSGSRVG